MTNGEPEEQRWIHIEQRVSALETGMVGHSAVLDQVGEDIKSLLANQARMLHGMAQLDGRLGDVEVGIDGLAIKVHELDTKVDQLDTKVDQLDTKVDQLDTKVDQLDTKVDQLDTKVDANHGEVMGAILALTKRLAP